ncbi:uncharacterized protein LOC110852472 isoform X2 [Folsomia candida]|uniref:uncharacterized protein LOC110852472 isoform X2 n=1 Tax=Folsomia candida TaxID=158441 RepID=UPI001604B4D6|nr:uncharacterized protein LOC110852472 isoform X2 [Folsomia candida]
MHPEVAIHSGAGYARLSTTLYQHVKRRTARERESHVQPSQVHGGAHYRQFFTTRKEIINEKMINEEHLTINDVPADEPVFFFENDGLIGTRTKDEMTLMNPDHYEIHTLLGLKWKDPSKKTREITFGLTGLRDKKQAVKTEIRMANLRTTFNPLKPHKGCSYLSKTAMQIKEYLRERFDAPGSFRGTPAAICLRNVWHILDPLIEKYDFNVDMPPVRVKRTDKPVRREKKVKAPKPLQDKKGRRLRHCPQCHFSTYRQQHLNEHLLIHSGLKPEKFPTCYKTFRTKANVYNHQKICGKLTRPKIGYKTLLQRRQKTPEIPPQQSQSPKEIVCNFNLSWPEFSDDSEDEERTDVSKLQEKVKQQKQKIQELHPELKRYQ